MAKDNLVMFSHEFDGVEHLIAKDQFGVDRDFIRPNNIMVISENNTYPVKDCKEVDVQLPEQKAVKLQIAENGEFTPDTYSGEYYDEVTVQMATELTDEEITITENGTYKPSTGKMFSKVTVDVPCDTMVGYDEWGNPVTPYVDPTTGKLEIDKLPDHIKVTVNPTKTNYLPNEIIDYSGIEVRAYNKDDTLWTKMGYKNGKIPFTELIFPESRAMTAKVDQNGKIGVSYSNTKNIEMDGKIISVDVTNVELSKTGYYRIWGSNSFGLYSEYTYDCTQHLIVDTGESDCVVIYAFAVNNGCSIELNGSVMQRFSDTSDDFSIQRIYNGRICIDNSISCMSGGIIVASSTMIDDEIAVKGTYNPTQGYIFVPSFEIDNTSYTYNGKKVYIRSFKIKSFPRFDSNPKSSGNPDGLAYITTQGTLYRFNGGIIGEANIVCSEFEINKELLYQTSWATDDRSYWVLDASEINVKKACWCAVYGDAINTINPNFPLTIPIYTASSELDCGTTQPIKYSNIGCYAIALHSGARIEMQLTGESVYFTSACKIQEYGICFLAASETRNALVTNKTTKYGVYKESVESNIYCVHEYTYKNKTVYYSYGLFLSDYVIMDAAVVTSDNFSSILSRSAQIAWTIIYGDKGDVEPVAFEVPVKWKRPGDRKILETTFEIEIQLPKAM